VKACGEEEIQLHAFFTWWWVKVSGQFYALFPLLPANRPPEHTEWEVGWTPLLLWMLWKGETILVTVGNQTVIPWLSNP